MITYLRYAELLFNYNSEVVHMECEHREPWALQGVLVGTQLQVDRPCSATVCLLWSIPLIVYYGRWAVLYACNKCLLSICCVPMHHAEGWIHLVSQHT